MIELKELCGDALEGELDLQSQSKVCAGDIYNPLHTPL